MAVQLKVSKPMVQDEKDNKESLEAATSVISTNNLNAPKHGTVIPNRVFVGGISSATTELDLVQLFSTYGNVTGTKIISDRAGVSKGYGFVTFETEDEAKRLQKADNITLKERRLNIAPAIKKQGFSRGGYECATPTPMPCTSQVYRHNGVTFTFHNGMAFFPQPPPQPVPQTTHVEPSPVFQQGNSYGAVPPGSPGPAYPFSYAPQGQVYYPGPQYQYHMPQYDSCYDTSQVMVTDGSLVMPQYYNYIAPQPTHEIAYFQPAPIHPQDPAQSVQPIIYSSPRAYDSTIVYSSEPKCGMENGLGSHTGGRMVSKDEADCSNNPTSSTPVSTTTATSAHNNSTINNRRARETTPVVSLLKIKEYKEQQFQARRKHHPMDEGRRHYHLNNNNPDTTNRNLKQQDERGGECRRTPPPVSYSGHGHLLPSHGSRPPPVQVPQFPYYPRQILPPPSTLTSFFPPPQPPTAHPLRSRSYYNRPRYSGSGRGRGKWISKDEEVGIPLTPPITPRSESATAGTTTATQADDVVQSIQALAI